MTFSRKVKHPRTLLAYTFVEVLYTSYKMQVVMVFNTFRPGGMFHSL